MSIQPKSTSAKERVFLPMPRLPVKKSPWRVFAIVLMIAAAACFVAAVEYIGIDDQQTTQRDYIQYWAIGQQLAHSANPYDVPALVQLEHKAGLGASQPRISLSPPTVLWPVLPLGWLSPRVGFIAWSLLQLGCLSVANWLLWRLNGRPDSLVHLFGYAFAPALVSLMAGQLSIFLLLGVVLFLSLYRTRPFLAGAALLPCALKPHLLLLFALVLLIWVVYRRMFSVLYGFAGALLLSCVIMLCLDAHAWQQYFYMMHHTRILQVFIPTYGEALRFIVDRNAVWLQFIPAVVGSLWAIWYFWTRRDRWDWMDQGLVLLFASDVCSPYGFFTDECILLPFVLAALYRALETGRSWLPLVLIDAAAIIEVYAQVDINWPWYLWTTPAWLGWYLYAHHESAKAERSAVSP